MEELIEQQGSEEAEEEIRRYALIEIATGNVINTIVWDGHLWDGVRGWEPEEGNIALLSEEAQIGWSYADGVFTAPPVPEPPPPTAEQILAGAIAELANCNASAAAQIIRIQDRIDTIGYGIDAGEATEEDVAEQAELMVAIKAWKAYKYALGKVATQAKWPKKPNWPTPPGIPVIAADPSTVGPDTV